MNRQGADFEFTPHTGRGQADAHGESAVEQLQARIAELSARNAVLEAAARGDRSRQEDTADAVPAHHAAGHRSVSRAGLLKAAAVGIAGAAGVVAFGGGGATPALAATKDTNFTAYGTDTGYTPDATIGFDASDDAAGFGYGVKGFGTLAGILGSTNSGKGYAVGAYNSSSSKSAVSLLSIVNNGYAVAGETSTGTGVGGYSASGTGTRGQSEKGVGVHGVTKAKDHSAIQGENSGAGMGVHGTSVSGRGGVFAGGAAAVQIVPSKSNTHPRTGQVGDLMLDAQHRLWFCKRGGNPAVWKQLA